MNRRGFFRRVCGVVGGILTAAVAPVASRYRYGGGKVYGYVNFPNHGEVYGIPRMRAVVEVLNNLQVVQTYQIKYFVELSR